MINIPYALNDSLRLSKLTSVFVPKITLHAGFILALFPILHLLLSLFPLFFPFLFSLFTFSLTKGGGFVYLTASLLITEI